MEKVEIVVATTNKGKLREIQELLKRFPVKLVTLQQAQFSEKIVGIITKTMGSLFIKSN